MKILVVSQYFYPETFRINDLCFNLVKEGHSVTVLTGYPNYPEGYIYPEYKHKKIKRETIEGVDVIRVNICERRKNAMFLFLNYISYALTAGFKSLRLDKDYDAVFVFEVSPITQIIPAWLYKKRCKVPVIVNCQDIWPDVIKVYGIKEKSAIFSAVRKFSAWLYKKADVIITSSPGFNGYLENVCSIPQDKMIYLPNFAEDYYLAFGNRNNGDGKQHLLFAGNIGKTQNLDVIVDAIKLLDEPLQNQVMVDILGDGSFLEELKQLVKQNGLDSRFTFHGRKPATELKSYYELADAFLLTLEGDSPLSLTVPAKSQGYMGAGKPILAAINGGASAIIQMADCGKCVPAGDAEGFSKIIKMMLESDDRFEQLGKNGRNYFINNFTVKKYINKLIEILEDLT